MSHMRVFLEPYPPSTKFSTRRDRMVVQHRTAVVVMKPVGQFFDGGRWKQAYVVESQPTSAVSMSDYAAFQRIQVARDEALKLDAIINPRPAYTFVSSGGCDELLGAYFDSDSGPIVARVGKDPQLDVIEVAGLRMGERGFTVVGGPK